MKSVARTCAAIVAVLVVWFAIPSAAFSQQSDPAKGQKEKPVAPDTLEKCQSDWEAMMNLPECRDAIKPKDPTQEPTQEPTSKKPVAKFEITCGYGTTGGRASVLDKKTGSFHCTCKDPENDELVTGPTGSAGKSEVCLPRKQGASSSTTTQTVTMLCDPSTTTGEVTSNGNCACKNPAHKIVSGETMPGTQLQYCIDTSPERPAMTLICDPSTTTGQIGPDKHCSCADPALTLVSGPFSEEEGVRIEKCIREGQEGGAGRGLSDLQLAAGIVFDLGGRNGVHVGGGLTAAILGWPHKSFGFTVEATVTANHEFEDAEQLGTLFAVQGGVGPAFRIPGLVVAVMFYGVQWNRIDSTGAGLEGNNLGYQLGGGVTGYINPWEPPVAIKVNGNVGYGSVAGTVGGVATEAPMVQGGIHVGVVVTDGFDF
jgi:hypothetical protein